VAARHVFLSYAYPYNADGFVEQFRKRLAQELGVQIGEPPPFSWTQTACARAKVGRERLDLREDRFNSDIVPYAVRHHASDNVDLS
jgi:hypothetical protein